MNDRYLYITLSCQRLQLVEYTFDTLAETGVNSTSMRIAGIITDENIVLDHIFNYQLMISNIRIIPRKYSDNRSYICNAPFCLTNIWSTMATSKSMAYTIKS